MSQQLSIYEALLGMGFEAQACDIASKTSSNVEEAVALILGGNLGRPAPAPVNTTILTPPEFALTLDVSQYSYESAGVSACTPIAICAAEFLLERLPNVLATDEATLKEGLNECLVDGVSTYQQYMGSGYSHLAFDDIFPSVSDRLQRLNDLPEQCELQEGSAAFDDLICKLLSHEKRGAHSIAVIFTKPPETVVVVVETNEATGEINRYYLFDSHSRPHLGYGGAYLISSSDRSAILRHLETVFPFFNDGHFGDNQTNYMVTIMNSVEANAVMLKR